MFLYVSREFHSRWSSIDVTLLWNLPVVYLAALHWTFSILLFCFKIFFNLSPNRGICFVALFCTPSILSICFFLWNFFSLKLLGQLGPNYGELVFRWSSLRIVSDDPGRQPRQPPLLRIENLTKDHLTIISSEITGPIGPKLWWNGLWVVIFQNCVRRPRPPTKMATVTKNRKFSKKSL
jgi:hypothetical protein